MKGFKLTKSEWKALSIIATNFSAVFLTSLVIPVFIGVIDKYATEMLLYGLAGTIISGFLALKFAKEGKL